MSCVGLDGSLSFYWSHSGILDGKYCLQWNEPDDPHGWDNNYMCTNFDIGMQWSHNGEIAGKKCTQVREGSDSDGWDNNYVCLPLDSPYEFVWYVGGDTSNNGMECVLVNEPDEPWQNAWTDNKLCWYSSIISMIGLEWSTNGAIYGKSCVQWSEPGEPSNTGWNNNYVCINSDYSDNIGFEWSSSGGGTPGKTCIDIDEPEDTGHGWGNNRLCTNLGSDFSFIWSNSGTIEGKECIQTREGWDSENGWEDNYLCVTCEEDLAYKFAPYLKFDSEASTYPMDAQMYYDYVESGLRSMDMRGYTCPSDSRCENNELANIPTYYKIFSCGGQTRIVYYWWYGWQPKCDCCSGSHEGDWERIIVTLSSDDSQIAAVTWYQHKGWLTKVRGRDDFPDLYDDTRPIVYVGKNSHGSYPSTNYQAQTGCMYYADPRNPSDSSVWDSRQELIDINLSQQWWMSDNDFYSGIGTKPQTIDPVSEYCEMESCKVEGCNQSHCKNGDETSGVLTCLYSCNEGDCNCGLYCCGGCARCVLPVTSCYGRSGGKAWQIPQNNKGLI